MKDVVWVDELLQSLIKGHRLMDPTAWAPPNPFLLTPLYIDLWIEKILAVKKCVDDGQITLRELADALPGPACIRKELRWVMWGGKLHGWETERILEVITFYRDILLIRSPKDPFNLSHALWHSDEDIANVLINTKWEKSDTPSKRIIGQLNGNCPPLAWGLFTDFFYHRAYEIYGLYNRLDRFDNRLDSDQVLIIRQFGPFAVPELWPNSVKYFNKTIVIKCIYDNIHCDFDYINHFTTDDSLAQKLRFWSVEVDGRPITNLLELKQLNESIVNSAVEQDGYLKKLTAEELKIHTLRSEYYSLKEFFSIAGVDWQPDNKTIERVANKPLLSVSFNKLTNITEAESFWKEVFDPFSSFQRTELVAAKNQIQKLFLK